MCFSFSPLVSWSPPLFSACRIVAASCSPAFTPEEDAFTTASSQEEERGL